MTNYRPLHILLVALLASGVLLVSPPEGTPATAMAALALTVLIIGLMATSAIPEVQLAVLFFGLAVIFQIAPVDAVFSGFRSSAFWLVAGGIILGLAAEKTGLGTAVAGVLLRRMGQSFPQVIIGLSIVAVALALLIPAALARVIIMVPIVQAMADRVGFMPGSRGRKAMLLTAIMVSFFVPMTILPSNFPNVLLAGMSDSLYGVNITYGLYLLMNFPVGGLLKGVFVIAIICYFFGDRIKVDPDTVAQAPPAPLTAEGRRLAVIIVITVALWAVDFVHGVAPGWIAIGAAMTALLPGIGVMGVGDFRGRTGGFFAVFTVATIIGIGAVLAASGAGELIAAQLISATDFTPGHPAYTFSMFSAINIGMMLFATVPGAIAVMAPFAGTIAEATEMPVLSVLMIIVNGYSTTFFPYQASPMLAGLRISGVSFADGTKITFTVSAISLITILPLTYYWWRWLGYLN